ncbi:MAG: hypothetical protein OXI55_14645 [Gammaproteobacteria bacterium]|nr:hypothetical protein [Gammaproteobacteria bacterium]
MPNHTGGTRHRKTVTESEWAEAYQRLVEEGEFTRAWFREAMVDCNANGPRNFTTIGGVFKLIGIAEYAFPGTYTKA